MSIGSRIRFIRMKRGLTQKELGLKLGFKESSADVRVAHYESDLRVPREELLNRIADALEVSSEAITTNSDTSIGILHSLFALEDASFFRIGNENGKTVIYIDEKEKSDTAILLRQMLSAWELQFLRLQKGVITQEEYDNWRYRFPEGFEQRYTDKDNRRDFSAILEETLEQNMLLTPVEESYATAIPDDLDEKNPQELLDETIAQNELF